MEKRILELFEKHVQYLHWQNVLLSVEFIANLIVWTHFIEVKDYHFK